MNFESRNPATDELLGVHPEHDKAEIEVRLQRAWDGCGIGPAPTAGANRLLTRLAKLLEERAENYGRLITAEMASRSRTPFFGIKNPLGRPPLAETGEAYLKPQPVEGIPAEIVYESLGPIFSVQPWNVPFWQVLRFFNTQPGRQYRAHQARGIGPRLRRGAGELGARRRWPEGLYVNLAIPVEACAAVIADPRVRAVTVTGSVRAGPRCLRRKPPKSERERCWNSAVPIPSSFWRTPTLRKPCSSP